MKTQSKRCNLKMKNMSTNVSRQWWLSELHYLRIFLELINYFVPKCPNNVLGCASLIRDHNLSSKKEIE